MSYVYNALYTVTVGDIDVEIAEDKNAKPGKRYNVYEREDLGLTEQFNCMVETDDFAEAVKVFADMIQNQINGLQAAVRQYASSPGEPIRINFYCPLTVKIDDPEENEFEYADADNSYLAYHEDAFRDFLEKDLQRGGGTDLAEYFHGSPELREKLLSVQFDVENVRNEIYGCIHCETTEPVTAEEIEELRDYCTGQASDGFGEGLEQQPFKTSDGDLYVSYWDSDKDWFMLEDDEFWSQIESGQQMGGMQ